MAFPTSPSNDDLHTEFGRTFKYSSASNSWSVATPDAPEDNALTTQGYVDTQSLPLTGVVAGSKAFVQDGNKLFIFTGSGWFEIATINTAPTITSGADASYTLNSDGTPTVITLQATDPEGTPIIWGYQVTSGSLEDTAITNEGGVFTITPGSTAATFGLTFTASDGVNIDTSTSGFSLAFAVPAEILLVGGGGAGGVGSWTGSGGGGGGGVIHDTSAILYPGATYPIIVGAGAAGYPDKNSYSELQGQSSEAFGYTALGGGTGGQFPNSNVQDVPSNFAQTGGSGGGGTGIPSMTGLFTGTYENIYHQQAAAGTPSLFPAGNTTAVSYQNSGGYGRQSPDASSRFAGGGGGAGTPGGNASAQDAGDGGDGVAISITGSAVYYGGGGGGGRRSVPGTSGTGGLGGGGNAESPGVNGLGGGGGGINSSDQVINNSGGSGVVIIRTMATATATTGNPTITTDGLYKIYKFLTNGSITF
jgi:hypothetical protein